MKRIASLSGRVVVDVVQVYLPTAAASGSDVILVSERVESMIVATVYEPLNCGGETPNTVNPAPTVSPVGAEVSTVTTFPDTLIELIENVVGEDRMSVRPISVIVLLSANLNGSEGIVTCTPPITFTG